mgnify:CR=1 FL=1
MDADLFATADIAKDEIVAVKGAAILFRSQTICAEEITPRLGTGGNSDRR